MEENKKDCNTAEEIDNENLNAEEAASDAAEESAKSNADAEDDAPLKHRDKKKLKKLEAELATVKKKKR